MRFLRSAVCLVFLPVLAQGQDRLPTMPRYDRYEKLRREISGSWVSGAITARWEDDSKAFTYSRDGKTYRYDPVKGEATESEAPRTSSSGRGRRNNPERGRQYEVVFSTDGKLKAFHRDRNVFVSDADGKNEVAVTTDGNAADRTKNGIASWVYGEELYVREAMWFSPDARYLAYYRFDEKEVKDFYLTLDLTKIQSALDVEAYPKAGTPNPKVWLRIYDRETKTTRDVDVAFGPDGKTQSEYVYEVRWSPDGKELFWHRTNRKQNAMEWCATDPVTSTSRVILRETQPQSWTDNSPTVRFLEDGKRYLIISDRSGYRNLYLGNLDGSPLKPITRHAFDVERIERIVEKEGQVFYSARSAENPYWMQLHRVKLNGTGDKRITDPNLSHSVNVSPDGKWFLDVAETLDIAPETRLVDREGKVKAVLAKSDLSKFESLGLKKQVRVTFPAADGKTTLYGNLELPSDFDSTRRYPVVVSTYAGPESGGGQERFTPPNALTELGFILASFEGRGTNGRGKAFKDAVYGKLGVVEIDDQAAGARYLATLPYVDGKRIGIYGTSYGGYASTMAILRHPDVFAAACASSSVTDWLHYDTIYTERYMGLPWETENKAGYEAGSAMKYARDLRGRLMLFYGTADNNVHPNNTLQLAQALNRVGKSYEMMVGPDLGHASINWIRMWEFFMDNLVLRPTVAEPLKAKVGSVSRRLTAQRRR